VSLADVHGPREPASWLPPLFEVVIARKEEPDEADNALSAFLTHLSRPSRVFAAARTIRSEGPCE
jgi:hypothetical protein